MLHTVTHVAGTAGGGNVKVDPACSDATLGVFLGDYLWDTFEPHGGDLSSASAASGGVPRPSGHVGSLNAAAVAVDALQNERKQCNHTFAQGGTVCNVCVSCNHCTGYGPACVYGRDGPRPHKAGQPCGCGAGNAGCSNCNMCRYAEPTPLNCRKENTPLGLHFPVLSCVATADAAAGINADGYDDADHYFPRNCCGVPEPETHAPSLRGLFGRIAGMSSSEPDRWPPLEIVDGSDLAEVAAAQAVSVPFLKDQEIVCTRIAHLCDRRFERCQIHGRNQVFGDGGFDAERDSVMTQLIPQLDGMFPKIKTGVQALWRGERREDVLLSNIPATTRIVLRAILITVVKLEAAAFSGSGGVGRTLGSGSGSGGDGGASASASSASAGAGWAAHTMTPAQRRQAALAAAEARRNGGSSVGGNGGGGAAASAAAAAAVSVNPTPTIIEVAGPADLARICAPLPQNIKHFASQKLAAIAVGDDECSICLEPMEQPTIVPCGDFLGCFGCVKDIQARGQGCPHCKFLSDFVAIFAILCNTLLSSFSSPSSLFVLSRPFFGLA